MRGQDQPSSSRFGYEDLESRLVARPLRLLREGLRLFKGIAQHAQIPCETGSYGPLGRRGARS
jgi:hypothetical protein